MTLYIIFCSFCLAAFSLFKNSTFSVYIVIVCLETFEMSVASCTVPLKLHNKRKALVSEMSSPFTLKL